MTKRNLILAALLAASALGLGCSRSADGETKQAADTNGGDAAATTRADDAKPAAGADVEAILKASLTAKNGVGLDRTEQSDLQKTCSEIGGAEPDADTAEAIRKAALAGVEFPADGNYLGNWKKGEAIAANGKGMQYSDDASAPNGGNCYACHQLDPDQVAYGTLGPSLKNYGQRGRSEDVLKYTWTKIWNPHAYMACSHMPRFGAAGILTPDQMRDVMALLLDPDSPVNKAASDKTQ